MIVIGIVAVALKQNRPEPVPIAPIALIIALTGNATIPTEITPVGFALAVGWIPLTAYAGEEAPNGEIDISRPRLPVGVYV